jgi:hypothetical protein
MIAGDIEHESIFPQHGPHIGLATCGLPQCSVRVSLGLNIVNWGAAVYRPWVVRHTPVVGDPKPMFRKVAEDEEQREKAPDGW